MSKTFRKNAETNLKHVARMKRRLHLRRMEKRQVIVDKNPHSLSDAKNERFIGSLSV